MAPEANTAAMSFSFIAPVVSAASCGFSAAIHGNPTMPSARTCTDQYSVEPTARSATASRNAMNSRAGSRSARIAPGRNWIVSLPPLFSTTSFAQRSPAFPSAKAGPTAVERVSSLALSPVPCATAPDAGARSRASASIGAPTRYRDKFAERSWAALRTRRVYSEPNARNRITSLAQRAARRSEREADNGLALDRCGQSAAAIGLVVERRVVAVGEGQLRATHLLLHHLGRVIGIEMWP